MMNSMIANREEFAGGDRVLVFDKLVAGENGVICAEVIEIRRILGELTYLIETEDGDRKLVGAKQVSQVENSSV
jgi:hypothetical protein